MSNNVATLRLFPGITAATVRAFLVPPTRGLVLETYGAGNAPQRADLLDALKEGCDRGVVIVAISQCSKGSVSADYETGRVLLNIGVVSGGDMTPEVCFMAYQVTKYLIYYVVCSDETRIPIEQTRPFSCTGPDANGYTSPRRTHHGREQHPKTG